MNILGNFLNKTGKDKILILLLVGIILLVISIPTSKKSSSSLSSSGYDSILTDSEQSDLEGKLKRCLSKVEGVGDVDVIVTYDSGGKTPEGVIIVAKGGDNGTVATEITNAIEALLGLPAHKIKVLKMIWRSFIHEK